MVARETPFLSDDQIPMIGVEWELNGGTPVIPCSCPMRAHEGVNSEKWLMCIPQIKSEIPINDSDSLDLK